MSDSIPKVDSHLPHDSPDVLLLSPVPIHSSIYFDNIGPECQERHCKC